MLYVLYQRGDSWLHRLDARVKLLLVVCGLTVLFLYDHPLLVGVLLLLTQLALLTAGISAQRLGMVWRTVLPTMLLFFLLWALFRGGPGRELWTWRFVRVTDLGIAMGGVIAMRLGALSFLLFCWLFTTSETDLVLSLTWCGMPYAWGLTLAMAFRYVPTLANTFRVISEAQQSRALDLSQGGPLKRARAFVPITVAMLISALRTATGLAHALETRALGAVERRTSLRQLHFRVADGIIAALIMLACIVAVISRVAWGLGSNALTLLP